MNEFFNNDISEKLKSLLKTKIPDYCSILEFSNVKIYISYIKSTGNKSLQILQEEIFDYTNLEGCLCLVINRKLSCLFLQLYDYIHYQKEFELELYTNIDKGYTILHDNFHCIEYPSFFIGINFSNKINAEKMKNTIFYNSIISNLDSNFYHLPSNKNSESHSQKENLILLEISKLMGNKFETKESIVCCGVSREDSNLIYNVNREEFEKNIESQGIHLHNLDTHFDKKIKSIFSKSKNDMVSSSNNAGINEKYVEYSKGKRKSIYSSLMKKANNTNKQDNRRSSIKNVINLQVFLFI
jgi:hypothetical protein